MVARYGKNVLTVENGTAILGKGENNMIFNIELTKKGLPAIWECGGGATNTGEARIIADSKGKPKSAIFVKSGGHLSNGEHALFILDKGDIIVICQRNRKDLNIQIYDIKEIDLNKKEAIGVLLSEYSKGEWDDEDIGFEYYDVVLAATDKSKCYHCRESHYRIKKEGE